MVIKKHHPAIISEEQFNRVQIMMKGKTKLVTENKVVGIPRKESIWHKTIYCSCGRRIVSIMGATSQRYLFCNRPGSKDKLLGTKYMSEWKIIMILMDFCETYIESVSGRQKLINACKATLINGDDYGSSSDLKRELEKLNRKRKQISKEINELLDMSLEKQMEHDMLELNRLNGKLTETVRKIEEVELQHSQAVIREEQVEKDIRGWIQEVSSKYRNERISDDLIMTLVDHIQLSEGAAAIYLNRSYRSTEVKPICILSHTTSYERISMLRPKLSVRGGRNYSGPGFLANIFV